MLLCFPTAIVLIVLIYYWDISQQHRREQDRLKEQRLRLRRGPTEASELPETAEPNPDFDFAEIPTYHQMLTGSEPPPARRRLLLTLTVGLPILVLLVLVFAIARMLDLLHR